MAEKLGCLVIDVAGTSLTAEDREMIQHPLVGGVIFFAKNFENPNQIKQLANDVRVAKRTPLLLMVDQEGGRVQRFIDGFSRLPAAAAIGQIYDNDAPKGVAFAKSVGYMMASEILASGIDLSIAPVLDINCCNNKAIGSRAFHESPEIVSKLATAYINGMHAAGMASVGKHFPGHGSVVVDSHLDTPVDHRSLHDILQSDLISFQHLIKHGLKGMLVSHISFPAIDDVHVAGYSAIWINDILKTQLGFSGPILSDDLNMEGANISDNYADRVLASREAGCDFSLVCNNRQGVIDVLDGINALQHQVDADKWHSLVGELQTSPQPNKTNSLVNEFNLIMETL